MKLTLTGLVLCTALLVIVAPSAAGAAYRSCEPVVNPYPNTRYDGVDLRAIRARGVRCATARRVARGAHRKALGLPVPPSGVRRFSWHGWRVTGDLRSARDRYLAVKGGARVRWVF
jgi:hypothetical protein